MNFPFQLTAPAYAVAGAEKVFSKTACRLRRMN